MTDNAQNKNGTLVEFRRRRDPRKQPGIADTATVAQVAGLLKKCTPDNCVLELVLSGTSALELVERIGHDFEFRELESIHVAAPDDAPPALATRHACPAGSAPDGCPDPMIVARLRVVPKHTTNGPAGRDNAIRVNELVIYPGYRDVWVDGKKINLSTCQFDVLAYLARKPGWVFTPEQIIEAVRGPETDTLLSAVRVHISAIRKRLGPAGKYVETVRNIGYRLAEPS